MDAAIGPDTAPRRSARGERIPARLAERLRRHRGAPDRRDPAEWIERLLHAQRRRYGDSQMAQDITPTQVRFQSWFRSKREELLRSADLAKDHSGLIGSHREHLIRAFLAEFLPRRLSVDRGIIYNSIDRSGECDAVVWDSWNYPRLAMMDHSSFLVESVLCVIEVKSTYSADEMSACLERAKKIRQLSIGASGPFLRQAHLLEQLYAEIAALRDGVEYRGMSIVEPRAAYGVVFLNGGESIALPSLFDPQSDLHNTAPNFVAFLSPGMFVRKYEPSRDELEDGETPALFLSRPGENVLISVASAVLREVAIRSPGSDGLWDLGSYDPSAFADNQETEIMEFTLSHSPSGYSRYFGTPGSG